MPSFSLDHVRLLCIQFSFSNEKFAPTSLWSRATESEQESIVRNTRNNENKDTNAIISPPFPEQVDLSELPSGLVSAHWQLVNATMQTRINNNSPKKGSLYVTSKFEFAKPEWATTDQDFERRFRALAYAELQGLCDMALWRIRLFRNPFYKNGDIVPDFNYFSINCESRVPRYINNGRPDARAVALDKLNINPIGNTLFLGEVRDQVYHYL